MIATLITEDEGTTGQGYTLTRTYRTAPGNRVLRLRIKRDFYARQSAAVAEVLTDSMEWNDIATMSPARWHADTPIRLTGETTPDDALCTVAASLLDTVVEILSVTQS